ncbi:MAG: CotH kinase family protein [Chitinophagales bacterium]|nr:CotH kinase family protein [Chitinophagales bacterium]
MMSIKNLLLFFSFILFSCQKESKPLPVLFIHAEDNMDIHKRSKAKLVHIYHSQTQIFEGDIRYRGGYSLRYNKKSFDFNLKKKIPLGGLPKEDDWVLNASYVDKTFNRHKLGYDLFRKMNLNNIAPQSMYIEVYQDAQPKGLFILMQKLTAKVLGVNKKDAAAFVFKEPPVFYIDEMHLQDTLNIFQQKYPKLSVIDKKDFLMSFREFLLKSDEKVFSKEINQWIDMENIIDWFIILLLANAGDNIVKNFYLYKVDSITPMRVALWDFDHSFGRDGDNEMNLNERPLNMKRSILFVRLWNNPYLNFNQRLMDRWHELRNNQMISESEIHKMIDRNVRIIQPYISKNNRLWPKNSPDYYDDNDFYQELALMDSFIKSRIKDLDKLFCYPN